MLDTSSNHSMLKTLGVFAVIVVTAAGLVFFTQTSTNKDSGTDLRARASNELDRIVDTDALFSAGESDLDQMENDLDVSDVMADDNSDETDLAELQAL